MNYINEFAIVSYVIFTYKNRIGAVKNRDFSKITMIHELYEIINIIT